MDESTIVDIDPGDDHVADYEDHFVCLLPEKPSKFTLFTEESVSTTSTPSLSPTFMENPDNSDQRRHEISSRTNSEPIGTVFTWTKRVRNSSEKIRNVRTDPTLSKKCPSPGSLSKKIRRYYQKQTDLLENFKTDNKSIQLLERQRNIITSETTDQLEDLVELDSLCGRQSSTEIQEWTSSKSFRRSSVKPRIKVANGRILDPDKRSTEKIGTRDRSRRLAAITMSVNIALLAIKSVAVYLSGSFAIISSVVDSSVDITSGLIIWLAVRAIRKRDPYLYPRGRTRLEPLALVIVSVIMGIASGQMIVESIEVIIRQSVNPNVGLSTVIIMIVTIVIKFGLILLCLRCSDDASAKILIQDHRNDCISNAVALVCAFLADRFWVYLDPIGAIVVSVYIAGTWFLTGKDHMVMLSGRTAEPDFINRIIKVCLDYDERIEFIDTVYVYHFGTKFLVEVHIVLDPDLPLRIVHDLSERLQISIEHFPEVERAFVHCDYEAEHRPEDEHKIV